MTRHHLLIGMLLIVCNTPSVFGQQTADSIVYETGIEWYALTPAQQVLAFTQYGTTCWYVTDGGMFTINLSSRRSRGITLPAALDPASIACLAFDGNTLWIGTSAGLYTQNSRGTRAVTGDNAPADQQINALCITGDNTVWVGTAAGLYAGAAGKWHTFPGDSGPVGPVIHDLCEGPAHVVWCATNKGISRHEAGRWKHVTMQNGLSWNSTHACAFDTRTGILWAAVGDGDINAISTDGVTEYLAVASDVSDIMIDTQSRIWLGSPSAGLMKFNGEEWIADPSRLGLPVSSITGMHRDAQGNLYFGSDKGLIKLENPYPF